MDDFPIVRITTVLGICVSMSVNWEVFPEEVCVHFTLCVPEICALLYIYKHLSTGMQIIYL